MGKAMMMEKQMMMFKQKQMMMNKQKAMMMRRQKEMMMKRQQQQQQQQGPEETRLGAERASSNVSMAGNVRQDCRVTAWSPWSHQCSSTCGSGVRHRFRTV